jgi:pilus assembly protein CpaD
LSALAFAATGLTGCITANSTAYEPTITGALPFDGYRTRHPIILADAAETIDIPVGSQNGRLNDTVLMKVKSFAEVAVERKATGVTVMVPVGTANEAASYAASRQIAAALVAGGISAHAITQKPFRVEDEAAQPPIRIAYPRMQALVPHRCGVWPDQVPMNNTNEDYWNYGCATQQNIAAMVIEPTDLVTPRAEDASDPVRRTTVIEKFRAGKATKSENQAPRQSIVQIGSGGSN